MTQYAERNIEQLDEDGGYYFRHVDAMTGEQLHSKSSIAAELAYRDRELDRLKAQLAAIKNARNTMGSLADNNYAGTSRGAIWHAIEFLDKAIKTDPTQSLAKVKADTLRKVADELDEESYHMVACSPDMVREEADRIEKEADGD